MVQNEQEIFQKTLKFLSPIGSLDYKGLDFPFTTVQNPNKLHNMFECGDMTYHTGVLLRALAWRYNSKKDSETSDAIKRMLYYFVLSQKYNDGCLARNWIRYEGYNQLPEFEKNGTLEANFFGDSEPHGSYRYKRIVHDQVTYFIRYDISVDAIVSAFSGLYWVWKFGDDSMKQIVKQIAQNQLAYYRKTKWTIRDDAGKLLRYGRHWIINPICNVSRKIITYLAEGTIERSVFDFFLNRFSTNIPFRHPSKRVQFNNYMSISALAVLFDMGMKVDNSITTLVNETIREYNYLNNKIKNYFMKSSLPVNYDIPLTLMHSLSFKEVEFPVPHGNRHNTLNVWEVSAYRLSLAKQDGVFDLPQAWWLELYWCYK
jgi:hypothetical protein